MNFYIKVVKNDKIYIIKITSNNNKLNINSLGLTDSIQIKIKYIFII